MPASAEVDPGGNAEVLAAGGVVMALGRIAVVHRPRYDDWSLPKGKLDPGESFEDAALREIAEETGLACRLVTELDAVSYLDHKGRSKEVRYWLMEPDDPPGALAAAFEANEEVDRLLWSTPDEAGKLLDYEHDRHLVEQAARLVGGTT